MPGESEINLINGKIQQVYDPQSFVFSFKENQPMKYVLKEDKKEQPIITLVEKCGKYFVFGNADILIKNDSFCIQNQHSSFDYQGNEKALAGKEGWKESISIKRIVVIQFKWIDSHQKLSHWKMIIKQKTLNGWHLKMTNNNYMY